MKRLKSIVTVMLVLLTLLVISTNVQAVEAEDFRGLQTLEIVTPAGEYKTGDTITFVATFANNIAGYTGITQSLKIKFSESNTEGYMAVGTAVDNKITYQYTITEQDKGTLTLKMYSIKTLTGEGSTKTDNFDNDVVIKVNVPKTPTIVNWTDSKNVKITIENSETHNMLFSGLEEKEYYYAYITNGKKAPVVAESGGRPDNYTYAIYGKEGKYGVTNLLEKSGDIYVWIYQSKMIDGDYQNKCIVSECKIERPAQKPLGSRITAYISNEATQTFLHEPYDSKNTRKIQIKIGKITDNSILKSIKNGEKGCLDQLLKYAKNSKSTVYTGTVPLGKSANITKNMDLQDKAYYYVYTELDDENGTYYPVENVSLYQANISKTYGKNLYDYLDKNFKWDIADDGSTSVDGNKINSTKDNTVAPGKLPQTGEGVILYVCLAVVLTGLAITAIKYKKYNIKF